MPPIVGQCKVDPVTGISGDIYTAWSGDAEAQIWPSVLVSGSAARKLFGAAIAGIATGAVASAIATPWTVVPKNADFNAATWDHYAVDTSGGNVAATLPAAAAFPGEDIRLVKTTAANTMSLVGTVSGVVNPSVNDQWSAFWITSDGTNWVAV